MGKFGNPSGLGPEDCPFKSDQRDKLVEDNKLSQNFCMLVRVQPSGLTWCRQIGIAESFKHLYSFTYPFFTRLFQRLECLSYKEKVEGSSPSSGIHLYFNWQNICLGRSLIEDIGSNPIK